MGDWNTLHLLDEEKYESNTLKILHNPDLVQSYYNDYLKYCLKGACEWTSEAIVESMQMNKEAFRLLRAIDDKAFGAEVWELPYGVDHYHYRRFVSFVIFQTSAQFFPYFKMGKSYLWQALDPPEDSLASEILDHIFMAWGSFNMDSMGIRKIIGREDLSLLIADSINIKAKGNEVQDIVDEFIYFLRFAAQKGLGLLSGQNLNVSPLYNNRVQLNQGLKAEMEYVIYI